MQQKYTEMKIISMHILSLSPVLQLLYILYTFKLHVCINLVLYVQIQK